MTDRLMIEIGYIKKTHGVRGAVCIKTLNNDSKVIQKDLKIYIKAKKSDGTHNSESFKVSEAKYGNNLIVKLAGIDDLENSKQLVGRCVTVERRSLCSTLSNDEYLLNDLIGYDVHDIKFDLIGKIHSFSTNGVQDIAKVTGAKCERDLLMISPFIKEIDHENGVVIVDYPMEVL